MFDVVFSSCLWVFVIVLCLVGVGRVCSMGFQFIGFLYSLYSVFSGS